VLPGFVVELIRKPVAPKDDMHLQRAVRDAHERKTVVSTYWS
jgi:hypothetical protein